MVILRKLSDVFFVLFTLTFITVMAAMIAIMFILLKYPIVYVVSGSMEPAIMTGDCVIAQDNVTVDDCEVGDVVVYRSYDGKRIVHRVIDKQQFDDSSSFLVVKGDANPRPDAEVVTDTNILWKVIYVPKTAMLRKIITSVRANMLGTAFIGAMFVAVAAVVFSRPVRELDFLQLKTSITNTDVAFGENLAGGEGSGSLNGGLGGLSSSDSSGVFEFYSIEDNVRSIVGDCESSSVIDSVIENSSYSDVEVREVKENV